MSIKAKFSKKTLKTACVALGLLVVLGGAPLVQAQNQSIVQTKHNLSVTGPGPVHATTEQRICIFCHTPHGARDVAPLWNRRDSQTSYIPYNSPTLKAQPGQPTGASKLCLSCHDGTVALGDLVSEGHTVEMAGSSIMPPGHGLIGTDLRDDHPISFSYSDSLARSNGTLTPPSTWDPRVKLDASAEVQCTSCHNPHNDQWGKFMVMDNQASALCRQCHKYDFFQNTPHADSILQWNGAGQNPWPNTNYHDVRTNACLNCHASHHAGGNEELLTSAREEEVCFVCHNGNVARYNLEAVFKKTSTHPVDQSQGVHKAGESPINEGNHVECADCHNPHRAHKSQAQPPYVKGVLEGVTGVDASGTALTEALYEYQICFKCHAGGKTMSIGTLPRQISPGNMLRNFSPSSPSFHPVETAGRNPDVPSLISPLTPASMVYCSDCHNNDEAQGGVNGSSGPHGSNYEFLLARQYRTGDNVAEGPTAYALCYGCHERSSILGDQSFKSHRLHLTTVRTSCSTCHDSHGIDFGKGNPMNNAHLINFDVSIVKPDPKTGRLEYRSLAPRSGECYLSCHGVPHSPKTY